MVLWKQLHHKNLLPFYGAYMTDRRFGMVAPWLEKGNIIDFTRKRPEVNRLCLVRWSALYVFNVYQVFLIVD